MESILRIADLLASAKRRIETAFVGYNTQIADTRNSIIGEYAANTEILSWLLHALDEYVALTDANASVRNRAHLLIMRLNRLVQSPVTGMYRNLEEACYEESWKSGTPYGRALLHPLFADIYAHYRQGKPRLAHAYGYTSSVPITVGWSIDPAQYGGSILRLHVLNPPTGTPIIQVTGTVRGENATTSTQTWGVAYTPSANAYYSHGMPFLSVDSVTGISPSDIQIFATVGEGRLL